jgi:subtilase family serine protease
MSNPVKILTLTLLTLMILACLPTFVGGAQQSEWQAQPFHKAKDMQINPSSIGSNYPNYGPLDIRDAYKLPQTGGSGTIAIIDAYDNSKAASDLAYFSNIFGLPAANLEVHKMSNSIRADSNWILESDLDIQWAHAVAPNAKILLVEATTASISNLMAAVDYASSRTDVVAVSMSWGSTENTAQLSYDSHFTAPGKVYFAASGDTGGVVSWPSSSPNVVSVGGTSLIQTTTGYTEQAWSGGGGGVSTIEPAQTWQSSVITAAGRATPDVSYNADPNNGFLVYDSYGFRGGWYAVGGTSAGAPQWAAIYSLGQTATNTNFYANAPASYNKALSDITAGSNGYPTSIGYDLATGLGSPIGASFDPNTATDYSVSASPVTFTITKGSTVTSTISINSIAGFKDTVTLTPIDVNGVGLSFSPTTIAVSPGQIALLKITAPTTIPVGAYQVSVQGSDGAPAHTATITLNVVNPDFTLSANPSSLSIRRGNSASSTITITPSGGYTGSPQLSATGQPTGVTVSFKPNPAKTTSIMTVSVSRSAPTGTYTMTVNAIDAQLGLSHSTTIEVTIR